MITDQRLDYISPCAWCGGTDVRIEGNVLTRVCCKGETPQKEGEFPEGKEAYCPRCYFEDGKVVLRPDCPHSEEVKLAEAGTPLAVFQKERTDAISEMFDNKYSDGIYPTSKFFARLDACVETLLAQAREEGVLQGAAVWQEVIVNGFGEYKDLKARCVVCGKECGITWEQAIRLNALSGACPDCVLKKGATTSKLTQPEQVK